MLTRLAEETHDGDRMGWNQDTGEPTVALFAQALQVWSLMQDRPTTVAEAAMVFNATPEVIRMAVEHHGFMFLSGDVIEHDGE